MTTTTTTAPRSTDALTRKVFTKAPPKVRLPSPWVWDDKLPFRLRACNNTNGYAEIGPSGQLHAQNAPKAVVDALFARFEQSDIR